MESSQNTPKAFKKGFAETNLVWHLYDIGLVRLNYVIIIKGTTGIKQVWGQLQLNGWEQKCPDIWHANGCLFVCFKK